MYEIIRSSEYWLGKINSNCHGLLFEPLNALYKIKYGSGNTVQRAGDNNSTDKFLIFY